MNDKTQEGIKASVEALKAQAEKAGYETRSMVQIETLILAVEQRIEEIRKTAALPSQGLTAEQNPNGYSRAQLEVVCASTLLKVIVGLADTVQQCAAVTALTLMAEAEMYRPDRK